VIENMLIEHPPIERRSHTLLKVAAYAGVAIGGIAIVCVLVLLLFPDPVVNRFVKPWIAAAFAEAYPAYSLRLGAMTYSVLKNRFDVDSIALSASDGSFSGSLGRVSVSAIGWTHLLWGGTLVTDGLAHTVVDAQDIVLSFPHAQYELRCDLVHVSVPDSEIVVETFAFHPSGDDEQLFEADKFRQTRIRCDVPYTRIAGVACLEALQGTFYRIRSAQCRDLVLDVLINKDKPSGRAPSPPRMPNELLSAMPETLKVDSVKIVNGRLNYGERFGVGKTPAFITLDSMQVLAEGFANHSDSGGAVVVHAEGKFMKAGTMGLCMTIPVSSPEFSLQYSGTLSRMDVRALNPFLEIAEQMRITAGVLQSAAFDIGVTSGHARGNVRVVYRDLTLAVIDKHTGSQLGFVNGLASFVANTFKIHGTNLPDKSGALQAGNVHYARRADDPFFRFCWFALRSGVGDVVGF
jgi:hypothetical protein